LRPRCSRPSSTKTQRGSDRSEASCASSAWWCAMQPEQVRAAIVQDADDGRVLMLAWMNDEAEAKTRDSGEAWFWSRSRERLWRKGETSGNTLAVIELRDDCDGDALLVRVRASGPACHTGSLSCSPSWLWRTIAAPAACRSAGSYTAHLLDAVTSACASKVGEEAVELAVAALDESDERVVEEAADLVYHLYVLLASRGLDVAQVEDALSSRS